MRYFSIQIILFFTTLTSFGQDAKTLTVSLGAGLFTSPYYKNSDASGFYSADFDYHFKKRHVLSANYNAGEHNYQDNVRSNIPAGPNLINSKADYRTFSVLYKYKFLNKKKLAAYGGAGAGIMTQILEYPYSDGPSSYYKQSSWTDLVFPVRLELIYHLTKKVGFGILGGFFVHPDFPVLGYHSGLKLSYNIQ